MCVVLKLRGYSQDSFVFDSANVQINPLNINTKEAEFSPFKIDNRLYYTSSRERRIGVINLDEKTKHQMLDIYYGELKDSVTVRNKKPLRNAVNNSLNQGTCFFDKQTSKLYYAGNVPSIKQDEFKLAIFSSEFNGKKFLKPRIELLLPDTFHASHPMVHDNKLYFSSNMKGGKGMADLYSAELVAGKWTNIKNLEKLNSPYDDYFPFVINDQEIYFSSNRPGGFGKLDLYKYDYSDSTARIRNLGKPVNSSSDDFGMFVDPKQESGYFSTNRVGQQDDIYHFKKVWPSFNDCVEAVKENYCYDFTDEKILDTDSLKGYFYEWDFGDGTKQKGVTVNHCFLQPGNYVINLNIIDISTKALFMNQTALDLYVDSIIQLKINALDTMLVNKKFTVNTAGTFLPDKKITGYYFEVDDKRIRKESFEYNFSSRGIHRIKLGIEYEDTKTKLTGLMCTTMNVNVVDSAIWLPYEKKKIDEMVAKFNPKNIQAGTSKLEDLNYDAELTFNQKLGLNKEKMADAVDDYLSSEITRQTIAKINADQEAFRSKNIGNNKSGLSDQDKEAFLAFKNKLKLDQSQVQGENGKNINGNKYGLSDQEEEAFLAFKKQQAAADSFNSKNIGNNKSGLSDEDEEALLVFKFKKNREQQTADSFNGKNIGNNKSGLSDQDEEAILAFKKQQAAAAGLNGKNLSSLIDTLLNIDEEVNITFRIHLGISKVKRDTTYLNSQGISGIKEEFFNNEYYYTYKNERRVNSIERYYQKALQAGIKEPIVIAYNNNILIPNQAHHLKPANFGENIKSETPQNPVVVKENVFARMFKKNKKVQDTLQIAKPKIQSKSDTSSVAVKTILVPDTLNSVTKNEDLNSVGETKPVEEKPKEENVYFSPVAIKPKDVKIEDLPIPEGEKITHARSYADEFIEKFGEETAKDLEFRVQISAFKYRNRYEFPHLANLGVIENTLTEGGITRISIGGVFDNYKKAIEHNKKVIAAGQKDAFVTLFYKGKRVYLEDLEKMGIFLKK